MEYTLLFNLVIYFTLVILQVRNMEYYKKKQKATKLNYAATNKWF